MSAGCSPASKRGGIPAQGGGIGGTFEETSEFNDLGAEYMTLDRLRRH